MGRLWKAFLRALDWMNFAELVFVALLVVVALFYALYRIVQSP